MRPLVHPPAGDMTVEGVLYALSDPVRARILIEMVAVECPQKCADFASILSGKPLPKSTLSQHFRILREAGLIRSVRKGKELHNTLRYEEFNPVFQELVKTIIGAYANKKPKKGSRASC